MIRETISHGSARDCRWIVPAAERNPVDEFARMSAHGHVGHWMGGGGQGHSLKYPHEHRTVSQSQYQ
jgi:hypothetical protein